MNSALVLSSMAMFAVSGASYSSSLTLRRRLGSFPSESNRKISQSQIRASKWNLTWDDQVSDNNYLGWCTFKQTNTKIGRRHPKKICAVKSDWDSIWLTQNGGSNNIMRFAFHKTDKITVHVKKGNIIIDNQFGKYELNVRTNEDILKVLVSLIKNNVLTQKDRPTYLTPAMYEELKGSKYNLLSTEQKHVLPNMMVKLKGTNLQGYIKGGAKQSEDKYLVRLKEAGADSEIEWDESLHNWDEFEALSRAEAYELWEREKMF